MLFLATHLLLMARLSIFFLSHAGQGKRTPFQFKYFFCRQKFNQASSLLAHSFYWFSSAMFPPSAESNVPAFLYEPDPEPATTCLLVTPHRNHRFDFSSRRDTLVRRSASSWLARHRFYSGSILAIQKFLLIAKSFNFLCRQERQQFYTPLPLCGLHLILLVRVDIHQFFWISEPCWHMWTVQ